MDRGLQVNRLRQNLELVANSQNRHFNRIEDFFQYVLSIGLGQPVPGDRFQFVRHHITHLVSAYAGSGFDRSLMLSIDGVGEGNSGRVAVAEGQSITSIQTFNAENSLGHFYTFVMSFIGFKSFDEYKSMGLAPYGDPARFRPEFQRFYTLLPDGEYAIKSLEIYRLFETMELRAKERPSRKLIKTLPRRFRKSSKTSSFIFSGTTARLPVTPTCVLPAAWRITAR